VAFFPPPPPVFLVGRCRLHNRMPPKQKKICSSSTPVCLSAVCREDACNLLPGICVSLFIYICVMFSICLLSCVSPTSPPPCRRYCALCVPNVCASFPFVISYPFHCVFTPRNDTKIPFASPWIVGGSSSKQRTTRVSLPSGIR